jgi:hypothetical protein
MPSPPPFDHGPEQPHPEGYTPSAPDTWSEPRDTPVFTLDGVATPALGASQVVANSSQAIAWAGYGLAVVSSLLSLLDQYQPSPWLALVLLILPLAVTALLLQSPLSFEIATRRNGITSRQINFGLAIPFGLLLLPNIYHAQVNPLWPLIPGAAAGLAMLAVSWTLKARQTLASPSSLVFLATICGALYGYAATSLADIQFDTSVGEIVPLQVMDVRKRCGRSCSYHLELAANGGSGRTAWADVSSWLYYRVRPGDTVCLANHPGALTLPWYRIGLCNGR